MDSHEGLKSTVVFLAAAVLAVPLFRRLGLGAVLGYLAAGSLLGPWGLGLIHNVHQTFEFGELGVVMLLFLIGLELKPSRLWELRRPVFGLGGLQVALTGALLALVAYMGGLAPVPALLVGTSLAFSSTAFALQILGESHQLNTSHGRASFAILLFQDLAAIPLLAVTPLLGRGAGAEAGTPFNFLKIAVVLGGLIIGGRWPVRKLLRAVASARTRELLTAASLLLVVGTAYAMTRIGLSMGLGAFLAGVLLADSEYRHELEADLEPFKGLLLGLFFMAVGMSVDYGVIARQPALVLALVAGLLLVKSTIIYLIGRLGRLDREAACRMALVLPQGGEFAFVLFGVAVGAGVLEPAARDLLVVVVALSMAATPLLVAVAGRWNQARGNRDAKAFDEIPTSDHPVIIAGFGRVGQITGRLLRVLGIGFTALDHDSEQVNVIRRFGHSIYFGDASRLDLLEAAGASRAKAFLLAIDDPESSLATARMVREKFPHLRIFARARNRQHVFDLMNLGVEVIQRETFESSLRLAEEVLRHLGQSPEEVRRTIAMFRDHDLEMLQGQYKIRHDEKQLVAFARQNIDLLEQLLKSEGAQSPLDSRDPPSI